MQVARRQAAIQRGSKEPHERNQHGFASIEAIDHRRGHDSRYHRAQTVRGNDESELPRRYRKFATQLITQWHHDHKVEDMREVDRRQQQNELPLG